MVIDRAPLAGLVVCATAFSADLLSKTLAVFQLPAGKVVYDPKPAELQWRGLMCAVALAVTVALAAIARRRGIGRIWGAWVGLGLLVAGVLANGVSSYLWSRGVPDFLDPGGNDFWNLADFEIAIGLTGGIVSIAVTAALAYARERIGPELPPSAETAPAQS